MLPLRFPNSGIRAKGRLNATARAALQGAAQQPGLATAKLVAERLQGVAASGQPARGGPAASAVASRGSGAGRKSNYWRARAVVAYVGATATAQRGQEGLGQSLYKKDDLAPLNSKNTKDYPRV
ncbi:hypothetical protein GW17_00012653 [Ensete ventricosum]|nr:hypothetical protein GW17_00012653 [Ensete ventricosum]